MGKIKIDKSFLVYLYIEQKMSTYQIAKILNVSSETIRRHLINYNIPIRRKQTGVNTNELVKLYMEGWTYNKLAVKYDIHWTSVSYHINKYFNSKKG